MSHQTIEDDFGIALEANDQFKPPKVTNLGSEDVFEDQLNNHSHSTKLEGFNDFDSFDSKNFQNLEPAIEFEESLTTLKPTKDVEGVKDKIEELQPDYLNPYEPYKMNPKEKFISTDDLIGLSDEETREESDKIYKDCAKDFKDQDECFPKKEPAKPAPHSKDNEPSHFQNLVQPTTQTENLSVAKVVLKKQNVIEAEKIFKKLGLDTWFKPASLHPKVESLIYWRDVKKSGLVFGSGLAFFLSLSYCSLISVLAYTSLLALAGTVAFRIYKNILQAIQKTSDGHPFKEYLELDVTLSQDRVETVTSAIVRHVNATLLELRRLFLVEDLVDSIKFGILLYCLTYVGAIFNGLTLITLGFIGLFALPKVYETNKAVIDSQFDLVRGKIAEITDKVKAVIPVGKQNESDKDK